MWDLIVSVPDHCLSFYFAQWIVSGISLLFKFKGCSALSNEKQMGYIWEYFSQYSAINSKVNDLIWTDLDRIRTPPKLYLYARLGVLVICKSSS